MYIILNLYIVYSPNGFLSYETITFSLVDGDKDDDEEGFEGRILCFMM